jgi:hypothetical protein
VYNIRKDILLSEISMKRVWAKMNKKSSTSWILPVLVIVGSVVLSWILFASGDTSPVDIAGWITGALLPASIFLYGQLQKHSFRFFLFTNRVRSFFGKGTLTWNLSVNYKNKYISSDSALMEIEKAVKAFHSDSVDVRIRRISSRNSIIHITPGPTLEIFFEAGGYTCADGIQEASSNIHVTISNYRTGYRQATSALKEEIIPVLETISCALDTSDTQYSFEIDFDKENNPFFGIYLANLPPDTVSKFFIRLNIENKPHNDTVLISESKISINTRSQNRLGNLALEFLTFSTGLQEKLKNA